MQEFQITEEHILLPYPVTFPVKCSRCEVQIQEYSFKRDIIRHCNKCHKGANERTFHFKCSYCPHLATDRRKATTHEATHFGQQGYEIKTYSCSCNRSFATHKALASHKRTCQSISDSLAQARSELQAQPPMTPDSGRPQTPTPTGSDPPTRIQAQTPVRPHPAEEPENIPIPTESPTIHYPTEVSTIHASPVSTPARPTCTYAEITSPQLQYSNTRPESNQS